MEEEEAEDAGSEEEAAEENEAPKQEPADRRRSRQPTSASNQRPLRCMHADSEVIRILQMD